VGGAGGIGNSMREETSCKARGKHSIMSEQNVVDAPSHEAAGDFEGDSGSEDFGNSESSGNDGGQPAPGMGQSKSSRRRRRKRRNKMIGDSPEAGTSESPAAQTIIMEGESLSLKAAAPTPRRPPQQNGGQQQAAQGQAQGKRWKKKFRDRERRPRSQENPGNDFRAESNGGGGHRQDFRPDNFGNTNGHFKRKGKGQSKERGFVGPMDHSYRENNGNGDGPPSTISLHAGGRRGGHRHHGDNQPIDYNMPRAIPIPEGAQTHIYFFIEELFFVAKIQETAKKLGVKVAFVKNDKDELDTMMESEQDKPALIVFDLNNANAKPLTLIPKLKAKLKKSASIIGFLSHIQGDLKAKAVEAGCDTVMPRSAFSQGLPNLLRRYGAEEAEEVNYNF
jgi:hypothetical protein